MSLADQQYRFSKLSIFAAAVRGSITEESAKIAISPGPQASGGATDEERIFARLIP
jgi:hypothetical protein